MNSITMTLDYNRVWETMNELESVTSKICSAREILACAIDAQESGNANRTETLLYAVDEYLQYYLSEFDKKFQGCME
jgi:DNA-binding MltR family transcriptional regulator